MRYVLQLLSLGVVLAQSADYLSARRKLDRIEEERVPAGSSVTLTARELNAWVREEVRSYAPEGVRNPRLELRADGATASAIVDFVKLREAQGVETSWLMARLFSGERDVSVSARFQSGKGRAQVDVESVTVSGVAIQGAALDFLIQRYVRAYFPSARVGEPFDLRHRIDRVDVRPGSVRVHIGR